MYTKIEFGIDLESELKKHFNVLHLSRWAYEKYLDHCSNMENGLGDVIMSIVVMEEGPEFECSKEELLNLANSLQYKI